MVSLGNAGQYISDHKLGIGTVIVVGGVAVYIGTGLLEMHDIWPFGDPEDDDGDGDGNGGDGNITDNATFKAYSLDRNTLTKLVAENNVSVIADLLGLNKTDLTNFLDGDAPNGEIADYLVRDNAGDIVGRKAVLVEPEGTQAKITMYGTNLPGDDASQIVRYGPADNAEALEEKI